MNLCYNHRFFPSNFNSNSLLYQNCSVSQTKYTFRWRSFSIFKMKFNNVTNFMYKFISTKHTHHKWLHVKIVYEILFPDKLQLQPCVQTIMCVVRRIKKETNVVVTYWTLYCLCHHVSNFSTTYLFYVEFYRGRIKFLI